MQLEETSESNDIGKKSLQDDDDEEHTDLFDINKQKKETWHDDQSKLRVVKKQLLGLCVVFILRT